MISFNSYQNLYISLYFHNLITNTTSSLSNSQIVEGYGQTECGAPSTLTIQGDYRPDHVGPPIACNAIKLVDVPDMDYYAAQGLEVFWWQRGDTMLELIVDMHFFLCTRMESFMNHLLPYFVNVKDTCTYTKNYKQHINEIHIQI